MKYLVLKKRNEIYGPKIEGFGVFRIRKAHWVSNGKPFCGMITNKELALISQEEFDIKGYMVCGVCQNRAKTNQRKACTNSEMVKSEPSKQNSKPERKSYEQLKAEKPDLFPVHTDGPREFHSSRWH